VQRSSAAAIQGHGVGRAVLDDDDMIASFLFLCVRIFCRVTAASKSPAQPSGLVPGWDWGGAAVARQAAGVFSGPDCLFEVLSGLFSVKVKAWFVISFFLLGLFVKLSPLLE
jgi:hypothetical protein